jgi:hypothetical protein
MYVVAWFNVGVKHLLRVLMWENLRLTGCDLASIRPQIKCLMGLNKNFIFYVTIPR